ncbi:MAG: hypothetical protein COV29_01940 [Candidatus Yanofskybacteria bacterium CG10_big_fil_rev_8_21_14_0_10_36_16]|uniref:Uncharacterized protein n=1 Tax=Candidatus Yanofskybacteria bacterium CG10_big_fil_rev_8_21_14_0_10_36_16 TaxID=1975096 RepID=A0A2J0Q7R0_9BACT|nr:MAG: hypothetical protein COV29_01940 [Candidatus Yanofskybacteria bacterium CG10_big_fil_rev_8_21_14_0_10_36_16]
MKPIKEMTFDERGKEIERLRKAIKKWANTYIKNGDERCHEVDEELANIVGMSLYLGRNKGVQSAKIFQNHCIRYIKRECRAGRLADDRD